MENLSEESDHRRIRAICSALDEPLLIKPQNGNPVEVINPPLISYRHYVTPNKDVEQTMLHQQFITDIALLPENREELLPAQSNLSLQTSKHSDISQNPIGLVAIAGVLDLPDTQTIMQLVTARTKVFVGGTTGKMVMQPVDISSSSTGQIALGITFTTEKVLLRPGSSGSAVMVYNKADQRLYIIGLLIGTLYVGNQQEGQTLYQAMALTPALNQLEGVYSDRINGQLKLCASELLERYDSDFMSEQGDQQQGISYLSQVEYSDSSLSSLDFSLPSTASGGSDLIPTTVQQFDSCSTISIPSSREGSMEDIIGPLRENHSCNAPEDEEEYETEK